MTYIKKPTLSQQQSELRELIDKRLHSKESEVRQQIYQWLVDNQYFIDNELFDFYFCVAQNIAAVEVLGTSGKKIIQAKIELEDSAETYTKQIVDTSDWINEQLKEQLHNIQQNQQRLDTKLIQVLEGLTREHENLQIISTGLVNSTSVLLKKQKQLLVQTKNAIKSALYLVIFAWTIPVIALLSWLVILLLLN